MLRPLATVRGARNPSALRLVRLPPAGAPRELAPAPSEVPSLRSSFSWSLAGNLVYAGSQWAMLVVLAKLGTPEMAGQLSIALAITVPAVMLSNLQLRVVQATDSAGQVPFATYLGLRIATTALALAGIAVATAAGGYRREVVQVVLAIAAAKAADCISDVAYGHLLKHERVRRIAQSMILRGVLALCAFAATVALTRNLVAASAAMAAAWFAVALAYDLPACFATERTLAPGAPGTSLREALRIARISLPLGVAMCLVSLSLNIPRYFIESALGEHALGVFTALASLYTAGTLVIGTIGSASARLSRLIEGGDRAGFQALLGRLTAGAAFIGALGVAVAVFAGRTFLTLVFSRAYAQDEAVFFWLMVASAAGYVAAVLNIGLNAIRWFSVQAPLFAAVCAATAAAAATLVPRLGLRGGALAMLAGMLVQLAGTAGLLALRLRRLPPAAEAP